MKLISVPVIDDTVTVIYKKLLLIVILNNDILTDDSDMESIAIEKLKQTQTLHKFLMHSLLVLQTLWSGENGQYVK